MARVGRRGYTGGDKACQEHRLHSHQRAGINHWLRMTLDKSLSLSVPQFLQFLKMGIIIVPMTYRIVERIKELIDI